MKDVLVSWHTVVQKGIERAHIFHEQSFQFPKIRHMWGQIQCRGSPDRTSPPFYFRAGLLVWSPAWGPGLWIICREGWVAQKGNPEHFFPLEASNSWEPEGWDCASISAHCWAQLSRAALPTCTGLWFMLKTLNMKALCPRSDWQVFKSLPSLKRSKPPRSTNEPREYLNYSQSSS